MSLARRGAAMDTMVKEDRWHDRYQQMPVDLYGKVGTRSAKRFAALALLLRRSRPVPSAGNSP